MKLVSYNESLDWAGTVYVDVRSPGEFEESTIPGAVNLPVFDNQERAEIGTIYSQDSPQQARIQGVEYLSPKLPRLMQSLKELNKSYERIILFCARGGMRSESLYQVANMVGFNVFKLKGGYKSYRHFIMDQLESYSLNSNLLVLHGYTGVGKTELLYKLKEEGIPIIDLEGLANHRGSAFGSIGLGTPTNQKHFDSLLWEKLEELKGAEVIAVEAESRRIGKSVLPDFFYQAMSAGFHVLIESSLERRVERIYSDYVSSYQENREMFIDSALESLSAIKKHIIQQTGKDGYQRIVTFCQEGKIKQVIRLLLENYYDLLYQHSQNKYEDELDLKITSDNLDYACTKIVSFFQEQELEGWE